MSIAKDLLLISITMFSVYKSISLYRKLNQQQNYFINTLSHDLRVSAIAQIRGLEILEKTFGKSELINEISNSCKYSLDMISMLLKTYQYEKGEVILNYNYFNIADTIKNICFNNQINTLEKNINICTNIPENIYINADKTELSKTIQALLSSVIFLSYTNKPIVAEVQNRENSILFRLTYHGKSLTQEECNRMFYNKTRFSAVGQGIKLHLCKKIIDFHNGYIEVKNQGKNINSFTIVIPNAE